MKTVTGYANSIVRRKRISRGKKEVGNFSLGTSPDTVGTVIPGLQGPQM